VGAARRMEGLLPDPTAPTGIFTERSDLGRRSVAAVFTSRYDGEAQLVLHTPRSYPAGALVQRMFWIGLKPADIHLNISCAPAGPRCMELPLCALGRRGTVFIITSRDFAPNHCSTR